MINKIIYTYWTNKGKNLLCGFGNEATFIQYAKGSLAKSLKITPNVTIYGDIEGKNYLESLGCTVDFIIVDYDAIPFNKGYWNFPKLITYNLQTEPFLHIDLDVRLKNTPSNLGGVTLTRLELAEKENEIDPDVFIDVSEKITSNYIICEKIRALIQRHTDRNHLPSVILDNVHPYIICSGILGTDNPEIFKKLYQIALPIVQVTGDVSFDMMFGIEEIVLTVLAKLNGYAYAPIGCKFEHYQGSLAKLKLIPQPKIKLSDLIIDKP